MAVQAPRLNQWIVWFPEDASIAVVLTQLAGELLVENGVVGSQATDLCPSNVQASTERLEGGRLDGRQGR